MNLENLQNLLGESFHEDMTIEEINNFFSGKKYADLSTGRYVDKNKYDRDIQNLNATITEKNNALNSKLTDEEKASVAREQDRKEIERLTQLLKDNTLSGNKDRALNSTSIIRTILTLKEDDTEYDNFINNIVSDDATKTNDIAKYVAKVASDAYEKGKKDAVKDAMGKFGNSKKNDGNGDSGSTDFGTMLAKKSLSNSNPNVDSNYYFKRK